MLIIIIMLKPEDILSILKKPGLDLMRLEIIVFNRVVYVGNGLAEHVLTAASLTLFKKNLRTIDFSSYIKFDRNVCVNINVLYVVEYNHYYYNCLFR